MSVLQTGGFLDAGRKAVRLGSSVVSLGFLFAAWGSVRLVCSETFDSLSTAFCTAMDSGDAFGYAMHNYLPHIVLCMGNAKSVTWYTCGTLAMVMGMLKL